MTETYTRFDAASYLENIEDVVSVGQKILVRIAEIDDRGKLALEPVLEEQAEESAEAPAEA